MTKLPHDNRDVKPKKGDMFPRYKVKSICAHPSCARFADHVHHIWRRSFMGGDYAWVELWDGTVVGNLCGLCWRHHEDVTVNKSQILWIDDPGIFVWTDNISDQLTNILDRLSPQPPKWGTVTSHGGHETPVDLCPECNRPKRKPIEHEPGEKRRKKTWTVKVPDDKEDGALVLDILVEEVAAQFGIDHYTSALKRYYVIQPALTYIMQNKITIEGGE